MYLQTFTFLSTLSKDDRRRIQNQSQPYHIIGDTLYPVGVDSILHQCLTVDEYERVLNEIHSSTCGGHLSSYATTQKILRVGYFFPSIFKDCILVVHKFHQCQIYQRKMQAPPTLLHPIIIVGLFSKLGISFMTGNPRSVRGNDYIIISMDYFTKWT